jgi:hypothetical protein
MGQEDSRGVFPEVSLPSLSDILRNVISNGSAYFFLRSRLLQPSVEGNGVKGLERGHGSL